MLHVALVTIETAPLKPEYLSGVIPGLVTIAFTPSPSEMVIVPVRAVLTWISMALTLGRVVVVAPVI